MENRERTSLEENLFKISQEWWEETAQIEIQLSVCPYGGEQETSVSHITWKAFSEQSVITDLLS